MKQPELTLLRDVHSPNDEDVVSCDIDDYDEIMIHGLQDDESRKKDKKREDKNLTVAP